MKKTRLSKIEVLKAARSSRPAPKGATLGEPHTVVPDGRERVSINSLRRDALRIIQEVITVLWSRGDNLLITEGLLLQLDRKWADGWDIPGKPEAHELLDWSHEAVFAAAAEAHGRAVWLHATQRCVDGRVEAAQAIYWAMLGLATIMRPVVLQHERKAAQALIRCAAYDESDAAAFSADPQTIGRKKHIATKTKKKPAKKPAKKGAKR